MLWGWVEAEVWKVSRQTSHTTFRLHYFSLLAEGKQFVFPPAHARVLFPKWLQFQQTWYFSKFSGLREFTKYHDLEMCNLTHISSPHTPPRFITLNVWILHTPSVRDVFSRGRLDHVAVVSPTRPAKLLCVPLMISADIVRPSPCVAADHLGFDCDDRVWPIS